MFYLPYFRSIGCWIIIGPINQGLKEPLLSYHAWTCMDWWNMRCTFPRVGYQFMEEILSISEALHDTWSKLAVIWPIGALEYPHPRFSTKLLTPKYGSRFILESLNNRSHQVNSIIMIGPCFAVACTIKPGD